MIIKQQPYEKAQSRSFALSALIKKHYFKINRQFLNFTLILFLLLSCGDKEEKKIEANDYLTVTLEFQVEHDDIFEVYFAENIEDLYNKKDRAWVFVKGSKERQKVDIKLPQRTYPLKLRIDLGSKGIESPIFLRQIVLSTGVRKKIIPIEELKIYFRPNSYLEFGRGNLLHRKKIDDKYDPYLISNDLTEIIVELFSD